MKARSSYLVKSKVDKKDEFYTRYEDVEKEISYYNEKLKGKVVYCNCDDYRVSNFVKYFENNFHNLGLKKLYATNIDNGEGSYSYSYNGVVTEIKEIKDGSFDSKRSIELLNKSDVVITNPPFSLFRDFVDLVFKHNKDLIIIGNHNAITYKNIFKYIMKEKLWVEKRFKSTVGYFHSPYDVYDDMGEKKDDCIRVNGVCWFSSINIEDHNKPIDGGKKFRKKDYKKFDNSDIINVEKVKDIPKDYKGLMGVPITYLYTHNAKEYKILGKANPTGYIGHAFYTVIGGKNLYQRILIQKKEKGGQSCEVRFR